MFRLDARLYVLLGGDRDVLISWIKDPKGRVVRFCLLCLFLGGGCYGVTLGLWRSPEQSLYTAIKFPLLILLTCGGNILLNGCLALVLGTGLSFRLTWTLILLSFAVMAVVLGAFAPIMLFLLWNTPPLLGDREVSGHSLFLLSHVALIALAGITGNLRLGRVLAALTQSTGRSCLVISGWLAGNLLLGSQIAWILRPFIGSPNLPVQFFRETPWQGNFFEAIARSLHLLFN